MTDSEPDPETESDTEDSGTESDAEDSGTESESEDSGTEPVAESDEERLEKLGEHIEDARRSTGVEGGSLDEPDERTLNDPEGDGEEGLDGAVPA